MTEYRPDWSDKPLFDQRGQWKRQQYGRSAHERIFIDGPDDEDEEESEESE